jgi:small subunit ribosomal protein S3Ae
MARGKNKKQPKKDKANKKGERHPFSRKEWFNIISPGAVQTKKAVGWTCCKRPQGTQVLADFLKGRVAEIAYSDITNSAKDVSKRIYSPIDEVQGSNCFTTFYKYELARDKISGMLRKRQSLIEVNCEVKTEDGVLLRVFVVVVSKKLPGQLRLNSYVKHTKAKFLRKKLIGELQAIGSKLKGDALVYDVLTETLQKKLEKVAGRVVPGCMLQIAKIKTVKRGAVDTKRLVEDFNAQQAQAGPTADDPALESVEAQNTLSQA